MKVAKQQLTNKQKRELRKKVATEQNYISLKHIEPLTDNQDRVLSDFSKNKILYGYAGTGKTFLASYLAMREILKEGTPYEKLIYIRSSVSTREIGHLPGSHIDKMIVFESPYIPIMAKLFNNENAYKILKNDKRLEFESSSFLRGLTFNDSIVIIDEFQNMTFQELYTIATRPDDNCKMIFSGDYRQNDISNKSGIHKFLKICKDMPEYFDMVDFGVDDIVRGDFVKKFIITTEKYKDDV